MEKMVIAPVILFLCALFAPPALAQTADSEVGAKAAQLAAEGKVLADEAQKLESIAKKIGKTARELQQQANIKKDIANVLDNIVGKWKCTRRFNYKYKYDNDRKHLFSVETFVFDNSFAFRRSGDLQSYILIEEKREIGGDDYLFRAMATVAFIFSSDREGYWNAAENEGQIQLLLNGGGQWKVKDKPQVGVSISKSEYWFLPWDEIEHPPAGLIRYRNNFKKKAIREAQQYLEPQPLSTTGYPVQWWNENCRKL